VFWTAFRKLQITIPKLDIVIHEDGHELKLGDTTLTFFLALGHTADGLITDQQGVTCERIINFYWIGIQITIWIEKSRLWFSTQRQGKTLSS
jgi:hypothetical protein